MKSLFIFLFLSFPFFSFSASEGYLLEDRLNQLVPRSNVVVLQRRYLPRTTRFELSPTVALFLSSEFLVNIGVGGSLGFNFLEKHGFEFRGLYAVSKKRQIIMDIVDKLQFRALNSKDRTQGSFGLVYKWFPLYGKMTLGDRRIIPFETFLAVGGGLSYVCSGVSNQDQTDSFLGDCPVIHQRREPTAILGFGQSYSISRNSAFRIDFNYHLYPSQVVENGASRIGNLNSDIILSFALSILFPEKGLR